jgi:hypothetical protein
VLFETEPALCRGDPIYLIGLSKNQRAKSRKSIVTNPYVTLNFGYADRPRYRAINMEVIELDTGKRINLNFPRSCLYLDLVSYFVLSFRFW